MYIDACDSQNNPTGVESVVILIPNWEWDVKDFPESVHLESDSA